ncbi:MAG TPA: peptide chain release factor 2 [Tenericutes bacterium]|nr:peptide chain release factor 2 [Mycoplasmatota bacterium]
MGDIMDFKEEISLLDKKLSDLWRSLDIDKKKERIEELNKLMEETNFWDDHKKAQDIINEKKELLEIVEKIELLKSKINDVLDLSDEELEFFALEINELKNEFSLFETYVLLSGPYDKNNAILEIHPGAGGTESMDWASMLYRMYLRWAENKGYKVKVLEYQEGEEAGLKRVMFIVSGNNAYGFLKGEKGIHRLVRISPFDANKRRHTSFASVEVMPEFKEDINIEIKPEDIKIDTYRSSGAGGQSVNTTDSAVRITHIPTGIIVSCQNERSQIQNKEQALKILKNKLYQLELEKREEEKEKIAGTKKDIAWGSQIRSYIFQPYTLVKDHRTNVEVGDVAGVMDGNIDIFIDAYLKNS